MSCVWGRLVAHEAVIADNLGVFFKLRGRCMPQPGLSEMGSKVPPSLCVCLLMCVCVLMCVGCVLARREEHTCEEPAVVRFGPEHQTPRQVPIVFPLEQHKIQPLSSLSCPTLSSPATYRTYVSLLPLSCCLPSLSALWPCRRLWLPVRDSVPVEVVVDGRVNLRTACVSACVG